MTPVLLSLLRIVLALAVVYGILAILAHWISPRMIFARPAAGYQPGEEHVRLRSEDGLTLLAKHWSNPDARYTILYFHGNAEDLSSLDTYMHDFVKAGYSVFALEYRGYGHSEGVPEEAATYRDARVAYEYVRRKLGVPPERILIYGYSLGSGPAVETARTQPAAGLVIEGGFVSTYRVMTRFPVFPWDKFENLRKIPQVTCPVLVMHGTADQTVPFWHGEAMYAAVRSPKMKLWVEGGGHGALEEDAPELYWKALSDFTNSLGSPQPKSAEPVGV
jgi:abhydrolase domain-containing protein 17